MSKRKLWLTNNWFGGYSDNKYTGTFASYQSSKGVEVRKEPGSISCAFLSEKDSASVVTDLVRSFVTIQSTGDVIGFGDTGKIYRNATGSGTWVNAYTDSGSAAILGAWEFNGQLYWATATNLHRIAVADIDADWTGDVTEDYKTFTNGNTNAHPMIELFNKLYIGDGNLLAELDSLGTFTADKLTIFGDEEIRALTFANSYMRIFARRSTNVDHGRQYFWNGITDSYTESVLWEGLPIHAAINKSGIDYVIAGRRPRMYASSGQSRQLLKVFPGVTEAQSLFMNNEAIALYNDLIVFGPGDANSSATTSGRGVWTWGSLNKDYPEVLNFDYPTSNDNATDEIGAVHSSNGKLYQSWKNASTYGIDVVNTAKYYTGAEVTMRVFNGDLASRKKEIIEMFAAFDQLATGEKIQVFLRSNLVAAWGSAQMTIDYDGNALDQGVWHKYVNAPFDSDIWNYLEAKIVLTPGSSATTNVEFTEFGVSYEEVSNLI